MLARFTRKPIANEELQSLLLAIQNHILQFSNPSQIILFGSAARGEFTDGSDIDLAILFEDREECLQAKRRILTQPPPVLWAIDYLFFSQKHFDHWKEIGGVCFIIREEGKILYERKA